MLHGSHPGPSPAAGLWDQPGQHTPQPGLPSQASRASLLQAGPMSPVALAPARPLCVLGIQGSHPALQSMGDSLPAHGRSWSRACGQGRRSYEATHRPQLQPWVHLMSAQNCHSLLRGSPSPATLRALPLGPETERDEKRPLCTPPADCVPCSVWEAHPRAPAARPAVFSRILSARPASGCFAACFHSQDRTFSP